MRLRHHHQTRRRTPRFQPFVERVEPRQLLSTVSEFPIPGGPDIGAKTGITSGPDGALWFVSSTDDRIGRLGSNGQFSFFDLPKTQAGDDPCAITLGPDGNLWFLRAREVGYITPSGQISEFPLNGPPLNTPNAIVSDPDGHLYFTAQNALERVSTSGQITRFAFPAAQTSLGNVTSGLVVGPDGALWFTRSDLTGSTNANQIGRMTLDGSFTFFDLSPGFDGVSGLAVGPDGKLWFTEGSLGRVGSISTDGTITEYVAPSGSIPRSLTAGPGGALYVSMNGSSAIGRLSTNGTWTTVPLPSPASQPQAITVGPDGRLWFTEGNGSAIGSLDPSSISPPAPTNPDPPAPSNPTPSEPAGSPSGQMPPVFGPRPPVAPVSIFAQRLLRLQAFRQRRLAILQTRMVQIHAHRFPGHPIPWNFLNRLRALYSHQRNFR